MTHRFPHAPKQEYQSYNTLSRGSCALGEHDNLYLYPKVDICFTCSNYPLLAVFFTATFFTATFFTATFFTATFFTAAFFTATFFTAAFFTAAFFTAAFFTAAFFTAAFFTAAFFTAAFLLFILRAFCAAFFAIFLILFTSFPRGLLPAPETFSFLLFLLPDFLSLTFFFTDLSFLRLFFFSFSPTGTESFLSIDMPKSSSIPFSSSSNAK